MRHGVVRGCSTASRPPRAHWALWGLDRAPRGPVFRSVVDSLLMWVCADSWGRADPYVGINRKEWAMRAVKDHFAQHTSHLLGCGVAGLLVVGAIVFSFPILAVFGAFMCGAMMIGMVWMMFSMVSRNRH